MFTDLSEIKSAVQQFRNDQTQKEIRERWDKDFDLFRLKPYDAGKGYISFTSNGPRVLVNKVLAMLQGANLIIRIPLDELHEKERKIAANIERFLYGCFSLVDEGFDNINLPLLRDQMAWMAILRAGFALKVFVKKTEGDRKTIPEINVWDLYSTAYQLGANGAIWVARIRKASKETILDEYPKLDIGTKKEVDVIDYWDKENNGVIVESAWAKELEPHGLKYCPVYPIIGGSMPPVLSDTNENTEKERYSTVYSANRDIYPIRNKTLSDLLTIVRRGVKTPVVSHTEDGRPVIDQDIYQVEKAAAISLRIGEDVKPMFQQTMPPDTSPLLQFLSGEEQLGGLSNVNMGQLGFRLSGFAINQLQSSLTTVIAPFISAMERAYKKACYALIDQFAEGGFNPIEVMGRTSRAEVFGYPTRIKIKSSDLKADWRPEVRLEPTLPKDDAQRYLLARMAREPGPDGMPLLSDDTIRDDITGVQDTDLEKEKILAQWGENLPLVKLNKIFLAQLNRGEFEMARITLMEIQRLLAETQIKKQPQSQAPTTLEQASMEMPGAGVPSGETGLPSSVMPAEMMGGLPGGAVNAIEEQGVL